MKAAKNLSEKVMKVLEDYLPVEGCGNFYSEHIESVIANALTAYAEERVIEDRKLWDEQHALDLKFHAEQARVEILSSMRIDISEFEAKARAEALTEGRLAALEEAAKIADESWNPAWGEKPPTSIGNRIRSLGGRVQFKIEKVENPEPKYIPEEDQ